MKPDVDGVKHTARARNPVVQLEVTVAIPGETAHRSTLGHTQPVECSHKTKGSIGHVGPGSTVDPARFDGHNIHVLSQCGRPFEDHGDRKWNVLHETIHVVLTPLADGTLITTN
jgi:hypothetical protein